jgi:hypothetical protein
MPWTPQNAVAHNKEAVGDKAKKWSAVANAVLSKTGSDASAIRIANSSIQPGKYKRMTPKR